MMNRLSRLFLFAAFLFAGCGASRRVSESELRTSDTDIHLVSIRQKDNTKLDFSNDPLGYAILRDSLVHRPGLSFAPIPVANFDLSTAYRQRTTGEEALDIALLSITVVVVLLPLLSNLQFPGW